MTKRKPKPIRRKPARPDTRGIKKPGAAFEQLLELNRRGLLPMATGPLPDTELPAPHRISKPGRA